MTAQGQPPPDEQLSDRARFTPNVLTFADMPIGPFWAKQRKSMVLTTAWVKDGRR